MAVRISCRWPWDVLQRWIDWKDGRVQGVSGLDYLDRGVQTCCLKNEIIGG